MAEGISQLRELAIAHSRTKYPTMPESARYIKPYSEKTANELTRSVIDFLNFSGHQAERVSVTGRYIDNTKVVTNVLGFKKKIGSGKWIKSSMQPGTSDLSAVIFGRAVKIEIKIGRDRQSEAQKKYQLGVERAGGLYWLVTSFDNFLILYNGMI